MVTPKTAQNDTVKPFVRLIIFTQPEVVLHHLLHLCPEAHLHAFYVHIYIWHRLPPDLPWALHEVQHMVGIDIARGPFGILGLKGYFRAIQKECTRMKQHPRPPNEESSMWHVMAHCIHLPAVQAVCKVLKLMDEQSLQEYLALRSELFSWVDVICAYLHVDEDDWTHPLPYCIDSRPVLLSAESEGGKS